MLSIYNFLKVKLCYRTYWKQWVAFLTLCFLVFACSEDEDNNNQNFLEKYDNVVWRNPLFVSTPQSIDELSTHELLIFNNENEFLTFYNPHFSDISQEECLNYFGTSNCDACDRWGCSTTATEDRVDADAGDERQSSETGGDDDTQQTFAVPSLHTL